MANHCRRGCGAQHSRFSRDRWRCCQAPKVQMSPSRYSPDARCPSLPWLSPGSPTRATGPTTRRPEGPFWNSEAQTMFPVSDACWRCFVWQFHGEFSVLIEPQSFEERSYGEIFAPRTDALKLRRGEVRRCQCTEGRAFMERRKGVICASHDELHTMYASVRPSENNSWVSYGRSMWWGLELFSILCRWRSCYCHVAG